MQFQQLWTPQKWKLIQNTKIGKSPADDWTYVRTDRRTDGWMNGRTDGRKYYTSTQGI